MGNKKEKAAGMKERVRNTCRVIAGQHVAKQHIQGSGPAYIFISGILGTGEYSSFEHILPYWGLFRGDLLRRLEEETGSACYAAAVGPISSAWDRACELYAQLAGGRVDYGKAHSEAMGHARYGRVYEPLFEGWSGERPVHFMAHSFGGATARLFAQLCAEGSPEERGATPGEELSPLFRGGMLDRILSITGLANPHNGTTAIVSIQKGQPLWPFVPIYSMMSFVGTLPVLNGVYDMHLEQFGLSNPAGQYRGNVLTQKKLRAFLRSRDHATADLSLDGAAELNRATPIRPELTYFSFPCALNMKELRHGKRLIPLKEFKNPVFGFWGLQIGMGMGFARRLVRAEERTADRIRAAVEYDPLWLENDVVVPLASALYPIGQPWKEYEPGEEIKPGVWHVMPVKYGVDHGYYCGWDPNNRDFGELVGFYVKHIRLLEETCGAKETAAALQN
jgi:triacylglycerol lipase